mgnify:CR=1 FL=1|tara:strand:- start:5440 stop:5697 length:258 start_codon:yes stop_codon:yes gene_type:complete
MSILDSLPSGWLIDPMGDRMILFIKDPMSLKNSPKFYIDRWSAINGSRSKFKNRKILIEEDAIRIWNNLIEDGWNKFESLGPKAA